MIINYVYQNAISDRRNCLQLYVSPHMHRLSTIDSPLT
jgi:hypothetical protein